LALAAALAAKAGCIGQRVSLGSIGTANPRMRRISA
jgi:hypothetical protein